jgi:hypothetical protein
MSGRPSTILIEFLMIVAGATLIMLAIAADQSWFDRHSLPHMFLSRSRQLIWWQSERAAAILLGLSLIWPIRHWLRDRLDDRQGGEIVVQAVLIGIAILMSLVVSEVALGTAGWRGIDRWAATEEPLRRADPHLGWTNLPGRGGWDDFGGRRILYYLDAGGHRIGDPARPVDRRRRSILFTGESIMLGFRLNWSETVAGRLEQATGLQSANLAVNGYGTDQALMRLSGELSRFERPVAVVALFAPSLIERNLDDDRPHLDAALRWHPPRPSWRLARVAKNITLYHRSAAIGDAIAMTRAALAETVRQARARNAAALILVPVFTPEQPGERAIRQRVLDDAGLPYVRVMLDPRWRLAGDGHPDARANRAMAGAVLAALHRQRPDLIDLSFAPPAPR